MFVWTHLLAAGMLQIGSLLGCLLAGVAMERFGRRFTLRYLATSRYSTVQYGTVQYSTVQYSTVQDPVPAPPASRGQQPPALQPPEVAAPAARRQGARAGETLRGTVTTIYGENLQMDTKA